MPKFHISLSKKPSVLTKLLKPKYKQKNIKRGTQFITKLNMPNIRQSMIIDGESVALGHGNGHTFSVKGLDICLRYFENLGYDVKAMVPQIRCKAAYSSDNRWLQSMERDHRRVCITPCKQLNGQTLVSDVNRMILDAAANYNGCVVTNHDYSDIVHQKPAWSRVLDNILNFRWNGDEITFGDKNKF